MGHPIKLIVKKGAVRKDGTSLIFLQYCQSAEQRVLLSTNIPIPPIYWNKKTKRIAENLPKSYGNAEELQRTLTEKLRRAEDMVEYALKNRHECPIKFLKENFHLSANWSLTQMPGVEQNLNLYENIDDYINNKRAMVKRCTINVISAMKGHLKCFEEYRQQAITFDSFDFRFYEDFVKFLTYDIQHARKKDVVMGLKANSVGKTIKHLKSFLKDRMRKKSYSVH